MLLIRWDSSVKSWRNTKTFWKNNKIKSLINKYKCKGTNFLSEKDHWKTFGKNYVTIGLNLLYVKTQKYILLMF